MDNKRKSRLAKHANGLEKTINVIVGTIDTNDSLSSCLFWLFVCPPEQLVLPPCCNNLVLAIRTAQNSNLHCPAKISNTPPVAFLVEARRTFIRGK